MIKQYQHRINIKDFSKVFARQSIASPIKVFNIQEYGLDKTEFIDDLANSFLDLPYDYYDVAFKIENVVKKYEPEKYTINEDGWLSLWNKIGRKEEDRTAMIQFWNEVGLKQETVSLFHDIVPHRKRSCFRYQVLKSNEKYVWEILEEGVPNYKQDVSDDRSRVRIWGAPKPEIIRNSGILKLIAVFSEYISNSPSK